MTARQAIGFGFPSPNFVNETGVARQGILPGVYLNTPSGTTTVTTDAFVAAEVLASLNSNRSLNIELLGTQLRDAFARVEMLAGVRRDALPGVEIITAARHDQGILLEMLATARADASLATEIVAALRHDYPVWVETTTGVERDAPFWAEILVVTRRDPPVPMEFLGATIASHDSPLWVEIIAQGYGTVPIGVEMSGLLQMDGFAQVEALRTVSTDMAPWLEGLLSAGSSLAGPPLEAIALFRVTSVLPVEFIGILLVSVAGNSILQLESGFEQASPPIGIEWTGDVAPATMLPLEFLGVAVTPTGVDTGVPFEILAGSLVDGGLQTEWQGVVTVSVAGDASLVLEWLTGMQSDAVTPLEWIAAPVGSLVTVSSTRLRYLGVDRVRLLAGRRR